MKHAIIHIGTEKTGTTTIQTFLDINRDLLAANGIGHLKSPGKRNNRKLAAYAMNDDNIDDFIIQLGLPDPEMRKKWKSNFSKELSLEISSLAENISTVIISSEHFHSRLKSIEEIQRLKHLLDSYFDSYSILVYLRRQDLLAVSSFSTLYRSGGHRASILPLEIHPDNHYYNYQKLLELWSSVFSRDSINVRIFEPKRLYHQDLLRDFIQQTNNSSIFAGLKIPLNQNKSLSEYTIKIISIFNHHFPTYQEGKYLQVNAQLKSKLISILEQRLSGNNPKPGIEEAKSFYKTFKESNDTVARHWFNRASLFEEDFSMYPRANEEICFEAHLSSFIIESINQVCDEFNIKPSESFYRHIFRLLYQEANESDPVGVKDSFKQKINIRLQEQREASNFLNKNKMQLYIHLGQGKTGSSAIQSFLNVNRNKLAREYGILYPNFDSQYIDQGIYHNHCIFFELLSENDTTQREVEKLFYLKDFCAENKIEKLVISCESLRPVHTPATVKLIEKTLSCETKLIVYVRRQDLLLESAWKQWGHKNPEQQSIHTFIENYNMDLKSIFDRYLSHFSADQFIVRTFEKSCIGSDVVLDFLNLLGIQDKQGFVEPPDNLNKNPGLAPEVVDIMKLCNYLMKSEHDNKLIHFMYSNLSARYKKKDPFKPYGFLSLEERRYILEKYAQSNREVARLFFNDGREDLFLEALDEQDNNVLYHGLTVENTVPVFMELILKQHQEIQNLQASIQRLTRGGENYTSGHNTNICILTLDLKQDLYKSSMHHQISHKKLQHDGIKLKASGPDPWIVFNNPLEKHLIRKVDISLTVPIETTIQLFYTQMQDEEFSEAHSVRSKIAAGQNRITLFLPPLDTICRFRIDPGMHAGHYIIHNIAFEYSYKV